MREKTKPSNGLKDETEKTKIDRTKENKHNEGEDETKHPFVEGEDETKHGFVEGDDRKKRKRKKYRGRRVEEKIEIGLKEEMEHELGERRNRIHENRGTRVSSLEGADENVLRKP